MPNSKRFAISLFALGLVLVAAAPRFYHARPQIRCSIPDRTYQFGKYSQPKSTLSNVAVARPSGGISPGKWLLPVEPLPNDAARSQQMVKSFQFVDKPVLRSDHCSVSQLSVLLSESGHWTVSLRADQNPVGFAAPKVSTDEPNRLFTEHLLRNQFQIVVRCYAGPMTGTTERLVGNPVVIVLHIDHFWVQRQQPYQLVESDYDARIRQYFPVIERVELEFVYRKD